MTFRAGIQAELFRHVSTEKAALYRAVMQTFAAAKRQFRLHLRPDEVLVEGHWEGLPAAKGTCMRSVTQAQCNHIVEDLNNRPRKRLGFNTPAKLYHQH